MDDYETPEQYYRKRAQIRRDEGYLWAAAFLDRLADDCAAIAAQQPPITAEKPPF